MMVGNGNHGYGSEVNQLLDGKIVSGVQPNNIAFMGVPGVSCCAKVADKWFRYLNQWTLITMACQSANVVGSSIY